MNRLDQYAFNVYSQNGEDGVLDEVFRRLSVSGSNTKWCVEFGAWDGRYLSNTFNFVVASNWNAVYIEGSAEKFRDLSKTQLEYPQIVAQCALIGSSLIGGIPLDTLLNQTALPSNYELLSIDIDSHDLEVWVDHVAYRPKVVCIEIDPRWAPGLMVWHSQRFPGNSFSATVGIGKAKVTRWCAISAQI